MSGMDPRVGLRTKYETVAASQTAQALGDTGAKGDIIETLIITPTTVNPGKVDIIDGALLPMNVFAGGAAGINELRPIEVQMGIRAVNGAWKVTTGANVSVIAIGQFS